MRRDWWAPLTGVAFVAVLIIGLFVGGEPPDAGDGAETIVAHYKDKKDAIEFGALISVIAASLFVWFGATLRDALRNVSGGDDGIAPNVLFAGTIITATGAAIDAMISFAIAEAIGDIDPQAVQTLQALWDNDFFPLALGISLFLLASGLSIVRRGLLPKWLGYIAIVLGLIGFTPIGFFAFLAGGLWVIAVSIMLTLSNRATGTTAGGTPVTTEPVQPVGVTR
jgi:hypothetical protein